MNRLWVARCSYKGKKDFLLGTVVADARSKEHEVVPLFHELWSGISPHPFPDSYQCIPGALIFKPE